MFFRGKKDKKKEEKVDEEALKKIRKAEKKEEDELVWDKKRVIIALFVVAFILLGVRQVKDMFFPNTNILGESTVKKASEIDKPEVSTPNVDFESNVTSKFEDIKDNIS
jgi:preprotein translocase subunit Sec63